MSQKVKRHKAEIVELHGHAYRDDENKVIVIHDNGQLPLDMPVVVEVERVMGEMDSWDKHEKTTWGLIGHIMTMDLVACGHRKVELKLYRSNPSGFRVVVEDEVVYEWFRDGSEFPSLSEAAADQRTTGADFVEMNRIKPGDEVTTDDEGVVNIKRAAPKKRTKKATPARASTNKKPAKRATKKAAPNQEAIEWE